MNQISIKSSARNTPEVKTRRKTVRTGNKPAGKIVFNSKFCSVTYLEFLHARIIRHGTSNKKFSGKVI